jgi:hypothetical protein
MAGIDPAVCLGALIVGSRPAMTEMEAKTRT